VNFNQNSVKRFCLLIGTFGYLLFAGTTPSAFTEEAASRGVLFQVDQIWDVVPFGDGLGFMDLDDDGDDDLVVLGDATGKVGIFENRGDGTFIDRSSGTGIPLIPQTSGVTAADYDRDGDLDLYISRWQRVNKLYRNLGNFQFEDVTDTAGVAGQPTERTTGCSFGDFNNDGFLDLAVGNRESQNYLYMNQGDGTFLDVALAQGVQQPSDPAFQISFFDFDRDSDADLYISNDRGMLNCETFHNYLFENINGQYTDITDTSSTHSCTDSMTVTIGDFTANGFQDLYVTSQSLGNTLMQNMGDGTFSDDTKASGVGSFTTGWGAVFVDFDNDTFMELYVCNMFETNRFYMHQGSWPCQDMGPDLGIGDPGESYAVAASDIDNDGDVDLALSNRGDPIRLFINRSGHLGHWVKFDVLGRGIDRWAIGANIDIMHNGNHQLREVIAGSNYKSQNSLWQHFGLGNDTIIDQITVTWLGGTQRTLSNYPADRAWKLYPTEKLGDFNGDGNLEFDDFTAMMACATGPFSPGCEVFDMDGNASIDLADVDLFLDQVSGPANDCDGNTIHDWRQIFSQPEIDLNVNGQLDLCECLADLDNSGAVDLDDIHLASPHWGTGESQADLDFNGTTNILDFSRFTNAIGACFSPPK